MIKLTLLGPVDPKKICGVEILTVIVSFLADVISYKRVGKFDDFVRPRCRRQILPKTMLPMASASAVPFLLFISKISGLNSDSSDLRSSNSCSTPFKSIKL